MSGWLAAAVTCVAAVAVGAPVPGQARRRLRRQRRSGAPGGGPRGRPPTAGRDAGTGVLAAVSIEAASRAGAAASRGAFDAASRPVTPGPGTAVTWAGARDAVSRLAMSKPGAVVLVGVAALPALVSGGPVAAVLACGYAAAAVRGWRRHRRAAVAAAEGAAALDALGALAADLRAGMPPRGLYPDATDDAALAVTFGGRVAPAERTAATDGAALAVASDGWRAPANQVGAAGGVAPAARRIEALAGAAARVAEQTGAPLADLLERIEADARAARRAVAAAGAQAAGARATAWLLAALPAGGVALGYGIGVDPLAVLLRTPIGGACALSAMALQALGLAWARRLARLPGADRPGGGQHGGGHHGGGQHGDGQAGADRPGADPERPAGADRSGRPEPTGDTRRAERTRRLLLPASVGLGGALLVGGWPGLFVGMAAAVGGHAVLRRMPPAWVRAERERCAADLPLAADLIAAALRAGVPVDRAVGAVADALAGPLGERLARVSRAARLGATVSEAWRHVDDVPAARRLSDAAARSAASGAALARALTRIADDLRADRAVALQAAAQRAGVLVVLPLGLCFLPAFVLAGLVPVVVAVVGDVL